MLKARGGRLGAQWAGRRTGGRSTDAWSGYDHVAFRARLGLLMHACMRLLLHDHAVAQTRMSSVARHCAVWPGA